MNHIIKEENFYSSYETRLASSSKAGIGSKQLILVTTISISGTINYYKVIDEKIFNSERFGNVFTSYILAEAITRYNSIHV